MSFYILQKTDEAFSLLMKSMIWKDFMVVYISESRILVYMIEAKFAIRKQFVSICFVLCLHDPMLAK